MQPAHRPLTGGVAPAIRGDNAFCGAVLDDDLLHRSRGDDVAAVRAQPSSERQRQLRAAALGETPPEGVPRAGTGGENRSTAAGLVREDATLNGGFEQVGAD